MKDETWGWGANLGLLYEINPGTRVGLTWNSQTSLDFSGPAEFAGLSPVVDAALSRAGLRDARIEVGIDDTSNPTSLTTSIPFKDTWHVAAGAQYRLSDPWRLNFGVAYDSGFQESSAQVSPLLPVNSACRFGVYYSAGF